MVIWRVGFSVKQKVLRGPFLPLLLIITVLVILLAIPQLFMKQDLRNSSNSTLFLCCCSSVKLGEMKAQRYIKNSAQIIDWDNRDAKQSARNGRHDLTYKPQPFAHRIRQQGWEKKRKKKSI